MRPRFLFYVSGHGFGHSTRTQAVINEIPETAAEVYVRTSAPEWLYRENVRRSFRYEKVECDIGVVQKDSITPDIPATHHAWLALEERTRERMEREIRFVSEAGIHRIVSDIPPLAFQVGSALGIPTVGVTNFSWDWIYRGYTDLEPGFSEVADRIGEIYGHADLLLRLPFHGDLSAFPRIEDVSLIAPRLDREPSEIRDILGVPRDAIVAVVSFGGFEFSRFRWDLAASQYPDVLFVPMGNEIGIDAPNLVRREGRDLRHHEIVAAADVVISKPGYGTVSECIAGRTPFVYTSRGEFAEYPILVKNIETYLPSRFVTHEEIENGEALRIALNLAQNPDWENRPAIRTDGAAVVAKKLLEERNAVQPGNLSRNRDCFAEDGSQ